MKVVLHDGFESGFYDQDDIPELTIPLNYSIQWREDPREGSLDRPEADIECALEGDRGVRSGQYGSKIALAYATFDACLYRSVVVEPGQLVRLEAWTAFYTKNNGDNKTGAMNMQVGIDPVGGTDFTAPTVVWGDWLGQDSAPDWDGRAFREIAVETIAARSTVTIFLRGTCRWRVTTSAVYFDDVSILIPDSGTPPTEPDDTFRVALKTALNKVIPALQELEDVL